MFDKDGPVQIILFRGRGVFRKQISRLLKHHIGDFFLGLYGERTRRNIRTPEHQKNIRTLQQGQVLQVMYQPQCIVYRVKPPSTSYHFPQTVDPGIPHTVGKLFLLAPQHVVRQVRLFRRVESFAQQPLLHPWLLRGGVLVQKRNHRCIVVQRKNHCQK